MEFSGFFIIHSGATTWSPSHYHSMVSIKEFMSLPIYSKELLIFELIPDYPGMSFQPPPSREKDPEGFPLSGVFFSLAATFGKLMVKHQYCGTVGIYQL